MVTMRTEAAVFGQINGHISAGFLCISLFASNGCDFDEILFKPGFIGVNN